MEVMASGTGFLVEDVQGEGDCLLPGLTGIGRSLREGGREVGERETERQSERERQRDREKRDGDRERDRDRTRVGALQGMG